MNLSGGAIAYTMAGTGPAVLLIHGLGGTRATWRHLISRLARTHTVIAPDLPGHGQAPGPFSPARAETCAAALVRDLSARKAIIPERTLLGGHSMGGAIAARVAANFTVAGVIAISPAPMHPAPEVSPEVLLFPNPPRLAPHSLVLSAAWEPASIKQIAADLVTQSAESSDKYAVIARTTHVSIIFAPATFQAIRTWSAQVLGTNPVSSGSLPALAVCSAYRTSLIVPPFCGSALSKTGAALSDSQRSAWLKPYLSFFFYATIALLILHSISFRAHFPPITWRRFSSSLADHPSRHALRFEILSDHRHCGVVAAASPSAAFCRLVRTHFLRSMAHARPLVPPTLRFCFSYPGISRKKFFSARRRPHLVPAASYISSPFEPFSGWHCSLESSTSTPVRFFSSC
jgi:pimeloyl-ACP methyl ester carboxylesterase